VNAFRSRLNVTLLLLTLLSACSSAAARLRGPFGEVEGVKEGEDNGPKTFMVQVTVRNNIPFPANLVAVQGRRRRGMGGVGANEVKDLETRWLTTHGFLVEVQVRGNRVCRTNSLGGVMPGQQLQVAINPDPRGTPGRDVPSAMCSLTLI
jgi:hypothetical protein